MEQRPAPVVTISDPTRPGEPVDVMVSGTEKEPWKPTRRHWTAVAVLALLAVAAVVPDKVVSARAADRRAELAAVEAVRISVGSGAPADTADSLRMTVSNDGPAPVTLLEVQVDGYQPVRLSKQIKSVSGEAVDLKDTAACTERLLTPGSETRARVRVRTAGGSDVVRRVAVPGDVWLPLNALAQKRCGYLQAAEALVVSGSGSAKGKAFELRVTARNRGKLPLQIGYVDVGPGLVVDQVLEDTQVPPGGTRRLVYSVRVQSCADARSLGVNGDGPQVTVNAFTVLSEGTYYSSGDETGVPLFQEPYPTLVRWFDGRCPA